MNQPLMVHRGGFLAAVERLKPAVRLKTYG
jgi:hypothetical protein